MSDGAKSKPGKSSFHFVAGLCSGVFTAVLLQPADLLKTRVQQSHSSTLGGTLRDIFSSASGQSPIRQLWRGTVPSAIRTGCGSALYFGGLNMMRSSIARAEAIVRGGEGTSNAGVAGTAAAVRSSSSLPKLSNMANLMTGALARTAAGFIMMPITVIKVRYESSMYNYRSLASASADIVRQEGFRGFFAGFGATAVRDAPYAGLYVLFYEQSKKQLGHLVGRGDGTTMGKEMKISTSASINFASGVVAAGTATAMTNPFDAIKTRLQLMPKKYGNTIRAARTMLAEEGIRSFFDGLALRMGRKAISSALAWTVYEELIRRAEVRWAADKSIL